MRKKLMYISTCCAALMSLSTAVMAAEDHGFTFGADYGRTEAKKYCEHITNCDNADKGPRIEVGYDFSKTFGMELGYTSFGTIFDSNDNSIRIKQKSNAVTLSVLGTIPIGDWFGIYGRLGYARYDTNNSGMIEGVALKDETGYTPVWGAGIKVNASEQFALRMEYQRYSDLSDIPGHKDDVQGLFLGGVYRF